MNECTFSGRLGKDPEARYLPSGNMITKFGVAVKEHFTGKDGERKETTTWVDFTAFGALGETITKLCQKGSYVVVKARYTKDTKDVDGSKRTYHNFVVESFELCGAGRERTAEEAPAEEEFAADGIPF